ncbi:hypothetical protein BIV23_27800 [Streptomyces monashensis]|uniref:Thioesterase domain-containing protein n=2 Tax=Streptomyces monashensis TaxID=1678012 RepID=A0A1S2Q202_9ACTN|nr:hypothetical protein BIV23_27800 [Streptomyces monashensis]
MILGHSRGAVIGYETARELARQGSPALALHVCAAFSPPEYAAVGLNTRVMTDAALVDLAATLGIPLPREDRAEVRREALRAIRTDLAMIDGYEHGPHLRPLGYPITVWSPHADTVIPAASAQRWQPMTRHPLTLHTLPVSHHCLNSPHAIDPITRALRNGMEGVSG